MTTPIQIFPNTHSCCVWSHLLNHYNVQTYILIATRKVTAMDILSSFTRSPEVVSILSWWLLCQNSQYLVRHFQFDWRAEAMPYHIYIMFLMKAGHSSTDMDILRSFSWFGQICPKVISIFIRLECTFILSFFFFHFSMSYLFIWTNQLSKRLKLLICYDSQQVETSLRH